MVEFGHVLPEPGGEPAWTAALPQSDREMMQAIGSGHRRHGVECFQVKYADEQAASRIPSRRHERRLAHPGWLSRRNQQKILASDLDETGKMGSRSRLLKFDPGLYTTIPFVHDHWEEVYSDVRRSHRRQSTSGRGAWDSSAEPVDGLMAHPLELAACPLVVIQPRMQGLYILASSFWNIRKRHANWISPRRPRALPALASHFSRRFKPPVRWWAKARSSRRAHIDRS
jgi:hypothetical protein